MKKGRPTILEAVEFDNHRLACLQCRIAWLHFFESPAGTKLCIEGFRLWHARHLAFRELGLKEEGVA